MPSIEINITPDKFANILIENPEFALDVFSELFNLHENAARIIVEACACSEFNHDAYEFFKLFIEEWEKRHKNKDKK